MTFRFHVVMDVDLLGSGLPARQQRGPIPAHGPIPVTRHRQNIGGYTHTRTFKHTHNHSLTQQKRRQRDIRHPTGWTT